MNQTYNKKTNIKIMIQIIICRNKKMMKFQLKPLLQNRKLMKFQLKPLLQNRKLMKFQLKPFLQNRKLMKFQLKQLLQNRKLMKFQLKPLLQNRKLMKFQLKPLLQNRKLIKCLLLTNKLYLNLFSRIAWMHRLLLKFTKRMIHQLIKCSLTYLNLKQTIYRLIL
jgi:hypothetical protein